MKNKVVEAFQSISLRYSAISLSSAHVVHDRRRDVTQILTTATAGYHNGRWSRKRDKQRLEERKKNERGWRARGEEGRK